MERLQEVDELYIAFLRGNVAVDETKTERKRGAVSKIRLDKFWPLGGDGF